MNVALRRPMSVEEFLAWEERQELRHEFDGIQPVAMVGGTSAHSLIAGNVEAALRGRLRDGCRVYRSDMKLRLAVSIRYPDVMVVCTPVAPRATSVTDPVVVFEVISESTGLTDRIIKAREYRDAPSIARYVIVEQSGIGATVFERPDWRGQPLEGPEARLAMPEIGVELTLGDFYADIDFAAAEEPDA
ncbi:MAG: Uma2 family endonuclease [Alphaproteobacteria bacterium]|nr:Uma2 family endonuclease [Alphaproteobacteria bacterium]